MKFSKLRGRATAALAGLLLLGSAASAAAQGTDPIDLEQRLYQYRADHRIPASRNVAVFEFQYPNGERGTIAIDSERHSKAGTAGDRIQGHSERRAARILRSYGIRPSWVTRILSELQPCSLPGAYCARMLSREFPQAKVDWLHEYGDSKESRARGNAAKRAAVNEFYRRYDEARNAMRVPGAKPPAGALPDALSRPGIRPGGIDFSSLELRYVSDDGPQGGGISYSMTGVPSDAPSDPAAGLRAAKRASDAFFAWLALPPQSFWVNLHPTQPDRIIDPQFARTDAGRVLLEADLALKRVGARLTDPNTPTGAEYWRRIDALYNGDPLLSNACLKGRVWVEPLPATVRETASELYIIDAPLTVKTEGQEVPLPSGCPAESEQLLAAKLDVYGQVILPPLIEAVNTSPQFAELRRVYLSRVAAEWVRARVDRATPLGEIVDSGAINPWAADPPWNPLDVFNAFLADWQSGEYGYTRQVVRDGVTYTLSYQMGGVIFTNTPRRNVSSKEFKARYAKLAKRSRSSVKAPARDGDRVWLGAGDRAPTQPRLRNERGTRQPSGPLRLRATSARRGNTVRLDLRLTNRGDARVSGIDVCDNLPDGLVFVRANRSRTMRDGRHCFAVRALAGNRSTTIRLTARIAGGARGALRNRATVTVADAPAFGVRATHTVRLARQAPPAPAGGVTG